MKLQSARSLTKNRITVKGVYGSATYANTQHQAMLLLYNITLLSTHLARISSRDFMAQASRCGVDHRDQYYNLVQAELAPTEHAHRFPGHVPDTTRVGHLD